MVARHAGHIGLNGTAIATRLVDKETGSEYNERLEAFRRHLVAGDLSVAVAMTDPKGRRDRRPRTTSTPRLSASRK